MDEKKIISFQDYKKKLKADPENAPQIDISDIKRATAHTPEQLEWYLLQRNFAKYELGLSSLFYENHQLREGHNPDSSFVVGFGSGDLDRIEQGVCELITELGRDYIVVDAANKPYRILLREIGKLPEGPGIPRMMIHEMIYTVRQLFYSRDIVIILKGISQSNLGSRKGSFIYSLIKILNDAHFDDVHPRTDLVFIDYAGFLQKIWDQVGPYLQVITA